jgi:hypothetical protein
LVPLNETNCGNKVLFPLPGVRDISVNVGSGGETQVRSEGREVGELEEREGRN